MKSVEHCMGTVFTIDIRDEGDWTDPVQSVVAWLHHVDDVFSTYRADSDLSRINRGELRLRDADPSVGEIFELCVDLGIQTNGFFDARDGSAIDPTGVVKGWAIERASELLRTAGSHNHVVNGGGDMQIAGEAEPGEPWSVGIADPRDPSTLVAVVTSRDGAVATSGTSERGAHLRNPFTGRPAAGRLAMSVVGPRLTLADAYATAAFVMEEAAFPWLSALPGYEGMSVDLDGQLHATKDWPTGLLSPQ